jgi:hypothetical protein
MMAEIIELPWLGRRAPASNRFLINEDFDGSQVAIL